MTDSTYTADKASEVGLVLVVEDDEGLNNLISKTLDQEGYRTTGVTTGKEAIEFILANPDAVLLIDMKLPDMTGDEIIYEIRRNECNVPFIVMTGQGDESIAVEMMKLGASDYIVKSLDFLKYLPPALQRLFKERTTERKLHAAENRLKLLSSAVEQSLEGFVLTDLKGNITFVNKAWRLMHGYDSAQELIGEFISIFHTPEQYKDEVLLFHENMLKTGNRTAEINHKRKDGSVFPTFMASHILRDKDDRPISIVCLARDITHHRKAEAERTMLATAIEQSAEAIVITNTDGLIQFVNPSFESITGYPQDEVIGKKPSILKSGQQDASFYKQMWDTLLSGNTWSGKIVNKKKNKSTYTEEATITPVLDPSGEIVNYVAVKRDISNEIKLQEQLRQSQKMEAVGQLAGGVAHDFNNILQGMFGYIMFAQEGLDKDDKRYKDIEEIRNCAEKAAALTSQLLSFSRRQIMQPKNLNLNKLIDEILKMIRRVIGEHIELNFMSGTNLKLVNIDPGQIEQVILNLCVNARDSMPNGGKLVIETSNITVDSEYVDSNPMLEMGQYVLFTVADTGRGMDSTTLEKIFEPFFTTKSVGKGTGLGLSMVHGIIKQHNGFISTYSQPSKGTIFRIYLPMVEGTTCEPVNSKIELDVHGVENILVAEDDNSVRNIVVSILEHVGYTVFQAVDGKDGVEQYKKHSDKIDLAIIDVIMPRLGGEQMYYKIKELNPNLPVLFSSGYNESSIHTNFTLQQDIELIQKPFNAIDLLTRIRKILDNSKNK